jgi:hypothetical protein
MESADHARTMDRKSRLENVLSGIHQARLTLVHHPDVFEATVVLKIAEADLASLISEMFPAEEPRL